MKLKKILWAFDGSDESKNALKYAAYLAQLYNSTVNGLYVNVIEYPFIYHYPNYDKFVMEKMDYKEKEFRNKFRSIGKDLSKKKIEFVSNIVTGIPEDVILKFSSKENIDLIIMGLTGRNFIDKMIVGSTTLRVLRKSNVPVLVVKSKNKDKDIIINKILVPVDLSDKLNLNLQYSMEFAEKNRCQITVLYVFSHIDHKDELAPSLIKELSIAVDKELKKVVDSTLKKVGKTKETNYSVDIKTKVIFSHNKSLKIVEYAKNNKFDLIAINSHRKKMLKRMFLGSVAEQVIRRSKCNVLILKPQY